MELSCANLAIFARACTYIILAADALVDQRGHGHAVAEHAGAAVAEIIKGRVLGIDRAVDAGRHGRRLGADVPRVSPSPSSFPVAPPSYPLSYPQVITLFNLSTSSR